MQHERNVSCQELQLAVAGVGYHIALFAVHADVMRFVELPGAADGANMRAVGVLKNLHAMILAISNNYVITRFVERKSYGVLQPAAPVANTNAALEDSFAVQHLDAIVIAVAHDKVVIFVVRDVTFSRKLAITAALLTEGGKQFSVKLKNLNCSVAELDSDIAATPVNCNAGGIRLTLTAFSLARKAKRPNELTGCIV